MKTTMSVSEMQRMLGLGRTESYRLIHMRKFEAVEINGKIRVVISSFEKWYEGQDHYKKVGGPPPGEELRKSSCSVREFAGMIGISVSSAHELIKRDHIETFLIGRQMRITKDSFERWYAGQNRYKKVPVMENDARGKPLLSVREASALAGEKPAVIYSSIHSGVLPAEKIGNKWLIKKEDFRQWKLYGRPRAAGGNGSD